jgi:protein-S-isoprenylcysteine O-methyltransferase Ste14
MKERIRLQGQLLFLAVMGTIVLSGVIFQKWHTEKWEELLDISGFGLIFLGFVFRIAARGYKSEHSSVGHILVKNGPYALTRNPMYFGTFLIGAGVIAILFQLVILFIFIAIFLLIYIPQIKKEEAVLSVYFREEYAGYCQTVPRFFPKMNSWGGMSRYVRIKISWNGKERVSLLKVIILMITLEVWRDVMLFGHQELLDELLELTQVIILFTIIFLPYLDFSQRIGK